MSWRGAGLAGSHGLHATTWGRRDAARVVICAHGYSGNGRDFDVLARSLAREARVVCPDMAGRGESDWLAAPLAYHFPQFLADVRALLRTLGTREVEWVGTSMGGLLGLMLASEPASPIRRLVLNDVGAFVPADALMAIGRNLRAPEHFATLAELEAHVRHTHRDWGTLDDAQWRHLARHHARRVPGGGYRLHYDPQIARLMQPVPFAPGLFFWDAWYRVRCPVLLIRGERSEVFPASIARTMLEVKPHAELIEVPDAGHAPALMDDETIAAIADFLRPAGAARRPARADPRARPQPSPAA